MFKKYHNLLINNVNTLSTKLSNTVSSRWFLKFTLLLFLVQSSFYALSIAYGVPPDERYHFDLIQFFISNNFIPIITNQESYFHLGEITRIPYILYHYLLSFPLALLSNFSQEIQVIGLRFMNILMALGSLLMLSKIGDLLKLSRFTTNLSIFIFSGAMMFTFLAGAINYDNLVILLGFLSLFIMLKLIKEKRPVDLMLWVVISLAGLLTKVTYIPILAAQALVVIFMLKKEVFQIAFNWVKSFNQAKYLNITLILLATILLIGLSRTYILNMITYGDYAPSCVEVHTHEQCLDHGIYQRSLMLDERDLEGFQPRLSEFAVKWARQMASGTFGTLSHNSLQPFKPVVIAMAVLVSILIVTTVTKLNYRNKILMGVLFIAVLYLIVLVHRNFGIYENRGRLIATQGRYLFPVLPLFYMIGLSCLEKLKYSKVLKLIIVALIVPLFLAGNVATYIYYSDASHYSPIGINVYEFIRNIIYYMF
ncbi:MAG: hypothetical protein WD061_03210 [Candidatus Saccharimonadales bacterium]